MTMKTLDIYGVTLGGHNWFLVDSDWLYFFHVSNIPDVSFHLG